MSAHKDEQHRRMARKNISTAVVLFAVAVGFYVSLFVMLG